jgi:hypothetical protein
LARNVVRTAEMNISYKFIVESPDGRRLHGRSTCIRKDNIKMDITETVSSNFQQLVHYLDDQTTLGCRSMSNNSRFFTKPRPNVVVKWLTLMLHIWEDRIEISTRRPATLTGVT